MDQRGDAPPEPVADHGPANLGDAVRGEAEVLEDGGGRRRRPEVVEPDDRPFVARPALHPSGTPISTLTRFRTSGGRTASR